MDEINSLMKEKRALSWQQFLDSGFDGREYKFPDFEGTYEAAIACKRWNRSRNLLVYLDFDDGRKILTAAWDTTDYYGLADMPVGARIRATFRRKKRGISFCGVRSGSDREGHAISHQASPL